MNKFLDSLWGEKGPKLSLIVAVLVVGAVLLDPYPNLLGRVGIEVNKNLAAGVTSCEGHLQWKSSAVGAACSKTPGCMWSNSESKCVSRTTNTGGSTGGVTGTASSPVSVTTGCDGSTPTAMISWPSKGNTDHWVDISTNSQFANLSNKNTPKGVFSTVAPDGFSNSLELKPGFKYYVRVYYPSTGERTSAAVFTAQKCTGGTASPTPSPAQTQVVTTSGPVSVDVKVNGKDGPFVDSAQNVNISWRSKNAVSCDETIDDPTSSFPTVKTSVALQNTGGDNWRLSSSNVTGNVVVVCTSSDGSIAIDSVEFGEGDEERRGYGGVESIDADGTVRGFSRIGLGDAPFSAIIICDSQGTGIASRQGAQVALDKARPDLGGNFKGFTAKLPDRCLDGDKHRLDIIGKGSQRIELDWFITRGLQFSVPGFKAVDLKVSYGTGTAVAPFTDGPLTITSGDQLLYKWTSNNMTSCKLNLTGDASKKDVALSSSGYPQSSAGLKGQKTITLTCTGNLGTLSDSVTVNIQ